jgi:hypothetical protein
MQNKQANQNEKLNSQSERKSGVLRELDIHGAHDWGLPVRVAFDMDSWFQFYIVSCLWTDDVRP